MKIVNVRQLIVIIPVGITTVIWQEQRLAKDVKNGALNRHTNTINQNIIITIVEILTRQMAVYGVIPRILIQNGSTVLKFKVCLKNSETSLSFTIKKTLLISSLRW